jgi:hypothetical protein
MDWCDCWRSLTTISDRQFISKTGEINKLSTHILLLLTYFHMYWRLSVLHDLFTKYMWIWSKGATQESVKQKSAKQKPTYTPKLGRVPLRKQTQTQPAAHQSKAVASGASPGAAAPGVRPHPHHRLPGPPCSGGCMATCKGGSWWLPNLPAPKPTIE